jgi:hypothetical protein
MAEIICLSCQHFLPREEEAPWEEIDSRWKGLCQHKDLEEANLVGVVHHCRRYLRIVYPSRFEKVLEEGKS